MQLKETDKAQYSNLGGPNPSSALGCIPIVKQKGPLQFLSDNAQLYGDIIPFRMGFSRCIQLNHPDLISHVLISNHKNYRKGDNHDRFREVLGDGLLTSMGNKWKRDRQMIQPAFKKDVVETTYAQAVTDVVAEIYDKWLEAAKNNKVVNVTSDMAFLTLKVILITMFGSQVSNEEVQKIDHAIKSFMDYVGIPRPIPSVDLNKYLHPQKYKQIKALRDELKSYVKIIYEREKESPSPTINMMQLLIQAHSEKGEEFSFEEIYDHSITMFFAGYETTATLLQWAWFCLDNNKSEAGLLMAELNAVDIHKTDFKELAALPRLDAFIKETMRLYPSFWCTTRAPLEADVIGGYQVPKGKTILLPQYVMHRHPRYWDEPDKFKTDRFMNGEDKKIPTGCYFPFSLGHRKCIGYYFAEMEAKIVLATLAKSFVLKGREEQNMAIKPIISLRLVEDLKMNISER